MDQSIRLRELTQCMHSVHTLLVHSLHHCSLQKPLQMMYTRKLGKFVETVQITF
jgi:hypothetical protein